MTTTNPMAQASNAPTRAAPTNPAKTTVQPRPVGQAPQGQVDRRALERGPDTPTTFEDNSAGSFQGRRLHLGRKVLRQPLPIERRGAICRQLEQKRNILLLRYATRSHKGFGSADRRRQMNDGVLADMLADLDAQLAADEDSFRRGADGLEGGSMLESEERSSKER